VTRAHYELVLKHEFAAEEGSFLVQLRCNLHWDRDAFSRLITAMEQCAVDHQGRDHIERWIAEGFWYLERFTQEWSTHANFPRLHGEDYYQAAYEQLRDLSYWLFVGKSIYQDPQIQSNVLS
jgi:hypothetical protein